MKNTKVTYTRSTDRWRLCQTVPDMKENGMSNLIKSTEKDTRYGQMEVFMKAIGRGTKLTDAVVSFTLTVISTMVIG